MALTVTEAAIGVDDAGFAGLTWKTFDITCDASYVTNGYPLSASDLGFSKILFMLISSADAAAGTSVGNYGTYDYSAQKLKVNFVGHGHTENTAGAYTQNASTSSTLTGTLVESERSAASNLSTVKFRIFVIGKA